MRAEDRHLEFVQKIENVRYYGPKRPITAGTPLANLAPVKAEARNKTDPIYEASKTITVINLGNGSHSNKSMLLLSIWGEGTFYVITFCVHKSFGTQFE